MENEMEQEIRPLSLNDRFRFSCGKDVACFNECCKDLNQFLTPYDILRLKNGMGLSSSEFLDAHTRQHTGPETGLPVVTLKSNYAEDWRCPFVTPEGCSVYENRPSSCRMYPLMRMLSRSRETGKVTEHYALLEEEHCRGFGTDKEQAVKEWLASQELHIYNEMNDLMMDIIALKNRAMPGTMDIKARHIFHMGCYDIDAFRSQIFEKGGLDNFRMDADLMEKAKDDDTALLKLGLEWVKRTLFE